MTKKKIVLISLVLMLFIPLLASVYIKGDINTLISYKTNSTPNIDGSFTESEWADAYHTSFFHEPDPMFNHPNDTIHIYIKNTQNKLYILIDDLPDNTSESDDHLYIDFDCNYDNIIDENISMYLRRDHAPNGLLGNSIVDWDLGFESSPNKVESHTIIEIAINITFGSAYDGSSRPDEMGYTLPVGNDNETIRILFDASPRLSDWQIPQNVSIADPTKYAELTLNKSPSQYIPSGTPILILIMILLPIIAISWKISRRIKPYQ